VVALYGATVGKTGVLQIEAASNQAVCAIFPKNGTVIQRYIHWFLRHKRPEFLSNSFGGAQPNISQKLLRQTLIPLPEIKLQQQICEFLEIVEQRQHGSITDPLPDLPPPLHEQRRIVARIEELAARIAEARGLRAQAAEEAEALLFSSMHTVFSFELGWKEKSVSDVCYKPQYGYTASASAAPIGPRFLRIIPNSCRG
jgi:restriction endonuclease S subunit